MMPLIGCIEAIGTPTGMQKEFPEISSKAQGMPRKIDYPEVEL